MPYICVSMKRIAFLLFSLFSLLVWNVPAQEVEPVWKNIVYKTVDGRAMTLDIYMPPPAVSARPCPVIVYIHGGSWVTGSKEAFVIPYMQAVLDSVLDEGYAVVSIGYLLADTLSGEASFPRAIVDCKDAVRWVRAHASDYGLDATRIGLWGSSAGAHLSLLAAYTPDTLFRYSPVALLCAGRLCNRRLWPYAAQSAVPHASRPVVAGSGKTGCALSLSGAGDDALGLPGR